MKILLSFLFFISFLFANEPKFLHGESLIFKAENIEIYFNIYDKNSQNLSGHIFKSGKFFGFYDANLSGKNFPLWQFGGENLQGNFNLVGEILNAKIEGENFKLKLYKKYPTIITALNRQNLLDISPSDVCYYNEI